MTGEWMVNILGAIAVIAGIVSLPDLFNLCRVRAMDPQYKKQSTWWTAQVWVCEFVVPCVACALICWATFKIAPLLSGVFE